MSYILTGGDVATFGTQTQFGLFSDADTVARFDNFTARELNNSKDVTPRLLSDFDVTAERGRDQIRALAPAMVGKAQFELWNASRDYSPENSGSPLYGYLTPGMTVQLYGMAAGKFNPIFGGVLEDISLHPEWDRRTVTITVLGALTGLTHLRGIVGLGQKVSTALYSNITTDVALGHLLDAIGWPAGKRVLDTGHTTLAWWWLDEEDAFQAAVTLINSEGPGAALYEDGSGNIVFESRYYRLLTARCTTSQATFNASGSSPLIAKPFSYDPRWKDVINVCTVTQKTRTQSGALSVVWSLGSTVSLAPSQALSYKARASDPFTGAVVPVNATDYTVTAGSLSSVTLNQTSGQTVTVTLTAGVNGATATGLQLRAYSVPITFTTDVKTTISTAASQAIYGIREYPLRVRNEIAINTLQDFCNIVPSWYQNPRTILEVALVGADDTTQTQILQRGISDRVTVVEPQSGMNGDCFIERRQDTIKYGGLLHGVRFGLEKAMAAKYFILDTSTLDGSDVLAW